MSSLLAPAHVMAVLAFGLLLGRQNWCWAVLAVYGAAVLIGLGAIALAYVPARAEEGLLAGTATAGVLLAWGRRWPAWIGGMLAAAIGLTLALDSPPEALPLLQANLELVATAVALIGAVWATGLVSRWLSQPMALLGARIFGSWVAASALLVLALRLVR